MQENIHPIERTLSMYTVPKISECRKTFIK
jgi:hypothetical protein